MGETADNPDSDNSSNRNSNTILGIIIGALLGMVAVIGFLVWDGFTNHGGQSPALGPKK